MAGLERVAGGMRLRLEATEVAVLVALAEGLARRAGQTPTGDSDPVLDRLAPATSRGDATVDAELRPLLREELLDLRVRRLSDFVALLRDEERGCDADLETVLDRADAMRSVEALNDLRLALATSIGYDGPDRSPSVDDAQRADTVRLLDALAWLQGGLIDFVDSDPGT